MGISWGDLTIKGSRALEKLERDEGSNEVPLFKDGKYITDVR